MAKSMREQIQAKANHFMEGLYHIENRAEKLERHSKAWEDAMFMYKHYYGGLCALRAVQEVLGIELDTDYITYSNNRKSQENN